jgi:hypothetical protein
MRDGELRAGFDPQAVLRTELGPGEKIVWWEQPDERAYARMSGPLRKFGLIFTGIAAGWMGLALVMSQLMIHFGKGVPWWVGLFPVGGVPFLVVGLLILRQPVRRARETVYGLTDRRAIVSESAWPKRSRVVRSYEPGKLTNPDLEVRDDGTGSLVFERVDSGVVANGQRLLAPCGFVGVGDVRRVQGLVRVLANSQRRGEGA